MEETLKKLTVVYVEDEEKVLKKVGRAIERRVGKLYLAQNGAEGLEMVRAHNPDIVITDLEMPVMNGLEMIEHIHKGDKCDLPIIVLTAYRDESHFTEKAYVYVYKPIVIEKLVEAMVQTAHECGII